uniref:G-protein coupled receptors family 1 profile domain-containing protein n=1 Tax=Ditylenchus dipsaci TaxID=166011 RepID=A0A915EGW2_9BILA
MLPSIAPSSVLGATDAMFADDCVFHPTTENYVMIVAFCIIFCLSVIGNSVVVVVILQQRSMRSVTNLYLLNLALSDLLLSVVCMPPTLVSSLVYCWVFGDLLCKLLAYLQPVVVTASAYTLAAIAAERYYAICKPLHSRVWHTRSHAMAVIAFVWLISIIINFLMLFLYELRTYNKNGLNCSPKYNPPVHFIYQIYMTVMLLIIPLVIMSVLYSKVIRSLKTGIRMDIAAIGVDNNNDEKRSDENRSSNGASTDRSNGISHANGMSHKRTRWMSLKGDSSSVDDFSARKNATLVEQSLRSTHSERTALVKQRLIRMLIVIVIIFFCCWTPSYIWWLLLNAQDSFGSTFNVWNSELNTFITVLTYLSSCTNPITYCFLNSKFRNALFLSFGCKSFSSKFGSGSRRTRTHLQRIYAPINNNTAPISKEECSNVTGSSFNQRLSFQRMSSLDYVSALVLNLVCILLTHSLLMGCAKRKPSAETKTCMGTVASPAPSVPNVAADTNPTTQTPKETNSKMAAPNEAAKVEPPKADAKTGNQSNKANTQKKAKKLTSKKAGKSEKKKKADGKKEDEDDAAGYENCSEMGSEQLKKIAMEAPSCIKKFMTLSFFNRLKSAISFGNNTTDRRHYTESPQLSSQLLEEPLARKLKANASSSSSNALSSKESNIKYNLELVCNTSQ